MRKRCMTTALCGARGARRAWALSRGGGRQAQDRLFTIHSSASNTFWQAVKKGFDDACGKIQANCQMIFTQTEGSIEQEAANMQAALARKPDALITTLVDNNAFLGNLQEAKEKGIIVIGFNVDATEGPDSSSAAGVRRPGLRAGGHDARRRRARSSQGRPDPCARRRQRPRPELVGATRRRAS